MSILQAEALLSQRPKAIIVDLDNTLALIGDRHPYHGHLCESDVINEPVRLLVEQMRQVVLIIILSSRNESARRATKNWLMAHGVHYHVLILRGVHDHRPANEYKSTTVANLVSFYDIQFALDDDPLVIQSFRAMGIPAFQVNDYREWKKSDEQD